MIAKILKPSAKFSGVMYSQKKINEGKASFSGAFNFPFNQSNASADTYIAYLETISDCGNSKRTIKNRQFHAIISTKGKEHDEKFLIEISKEWMKKMGYENQPFLLFFHGDTENNHIHIVSSRITKEGKRINPYNEGIRAVKFINELMNMNLKKKAFLDINDALNNYTFSTEAQFKLILEVRGWKVGDKENMVYLFKNERQGEISKDKVKLKADSYKADEARIKQLRVILQKYRGLPTEQFQNFLRSNFGIEVVFHKSKGHDTPYGYTVIDHKNKCVMKGSEIISMHLLLNPRSREEQTKMASDIIENQIANNPSFITLKTTLSRNGFFLKKRNVFIKGDDHPLLQIPENTYKQLHYNDRLKEANKFVVHSSEEAKILAILLYVRAYNINIDKDRQRNDLPYREMIKSFGNDKENLYTYLSNNDLRVLSHENTTLLVDVKNHAIANISGLGLDEDRFDISNSYERNKDMVEGITEAVVATSILGAFVGLFDVQSQNEQDPKDLKKRKKKKQFKL